jgi:hypothetical protein
MGGVKMIAWFKGHLRSILTATTVIRVIGYFVFMVIVITPMGQNWLVTSSQNWVLGLTPLMFLTWVEIVLIMDFDLGKKYKWMFWVEVLLWIEVICLLIVMEKSPGIVNGLFILTLSATAVNLFVKIAKRES